ncbi:hypothetical protein AAVH_40830 [Aphelenchoides avenae]|nr:hypothetical protein AAVH_40830 [Aphelenchus avenae]
MSTTPTDCNRDILRCLDPTSWEAALISTPKFAYCISADDYNKRPLRHASKVALRGTGVLSQIQLAGETTAQTFTWDQMPNALRSVSADYGYWLPSMWMDPVTFPEVIEGLRKMKPYWQSIDRFQLRSRYPEDVQVLREFAACFDNALEIIIKPFDEV